VAHQSAASGAAAAVGVEQSMLPAHLHQASRRALHWRV
jgi:hypothetical protein